MKTNEKNLSDPVSVMSWGGRRAAFSMVEILVVVGLLSIIIFGLLLMFNQTQKAFRAGLTQVDVLESGRIVTEVLKRELMQITPAYQSRLNNGVNFYAGLPLYTPLLQNLPGPPKLPNNDPNVRTNLLEDLFFMQRENMKWSGIGYFVRNTDSAGRFVPAETVGALYRFETSYTDRQMRDTPYVFVRDFDTAINNGTFALNAVDARVSKILDGVVHFKVRAYDANGKWQTRDLPNNGNYEKSDIRESTSVAPGEIGLYRYYSNAVPAFVEVEIGLLESRVISRAQAIPDDTVRRQYLEDQAARVHLFRLRVPIRNVDPLAYQ